VNNGDCDDKIDPSDPTIINAGPNGRAETVVVAMQPSSDTPSFIGELSISSGWRNPERNEAVGGAPRSAHQIGNAIDLKGKRTVGPWSPILYRTDKEILCLLVTAGYRVVNGCGPTGPCIEKCNHYPPVPLTKECRWLVQAEDRPANYVPCSTDLTVSHIHVNQ
jgi:hypothetical protein